MPNSLQRSKVAYSSVFWRLQRGLALSLALIAPGAAFAQSVPTTSTPDAASSTPGHSGLNLDLSSTQSSLHARNTTAVDIHVGGTIENGSVSGATTQAINPGQLLTPAQFLAVNEVLRGGQTLLLNDLGQAIGGSASISAARIHQLGSIVVPQNVSLSAIGFNASTPLNVSGNVNVLGSLFTLQTAPNILAVLQLGSLNVGSGGLLSGNRPVGLIGNIFSSSGMTLNVLNNVTNMGTITTLGNLNITAGGSITNQSFANTAALMSAQNINLVSGAGQIINSGLIQALSNINLNTMSSLTDLNVTGTAGIFQAINGAINIRDTSFSGSGGTNLTGGDWLSQQLNFNSGQGAVNVSVGQVSGTVTADAGAAHLLVDTPQLVLGNTKISGDPTYVNAGGDIQLVGSVTETEDLAIVAAGNITTSGAAQIVDNGHNVWLIAGAKIDTVNGSCVGCGNTGSALTIPPGTASPISSGYVQVSAGGGTGGNIDLQTGNTLTVGNTVIDTSAVTAGGNGGNVNLIAIANGAIGGQILFPTTAGVTSIKTSANTTGSNGNVTLIAGAGSGQAISVGPVTTYGGTGLSGGQVLIYTGVAKFSNGAGGCASCMSFDSTGAATGGASGFIPNGTNSSITLTGSITTGQGTGGGTLHVSAPNGSIQASSPIFARVVTILSTSGNVGTTNTPLDVNNGGGGLNLFVSSGTVNLRDTTTENVTLGGAVSGPGGVAISITGGGALITNGFKISSNNSPIVLTADSFTLSGTTALDAGSGMVTIAPTNPGTAISLGGSGSGLNLSAAELSAISAGTLVIGSSGTTGGITLTGPVDTSGKYNLQLLQGIGGTFTSTGQALTSGNKSIIITAGGEVDLGPIITTGANLQISGTSVYLLGPIGSSADVTSISATNGGIGGSGLVSAYDLTISSIDGFIGGAIYTNVGHSLTASVFSGPSAPFQGAINIINTGDLASFSAQTNRMGSVTLENTGNVVLGGDIVAFGVADLQLSAGSTLTIGGHKVSSNGSLIRITADHVVLGSSNPIDAGVGPVILRPASPGTTINLAGGSGGLDLTSAELLSITTSQLTIGENIGALATTGTIKLNGSLDVSASYRVNLYGGAFDSTGATLTIGNKCDSLNIFVLGGQVKAGSFVSTGPGTTTARVIGNSIELNESIVVPVVDLSATGSITGAGLVTATQLTIDSAHGDVGPLSTAVVGTLDVTARHGNIDVTNTGNVSFTAFAGGSVTLRNTGNLTLKNSGWSGALNPDRPIIYGENFSIYGPAGISLALNSGSSFSFNGYRILSVNSPITLKVDQYDGVIGVNNVNAGTGLFWLSPATDSMPLNIDGIAGGLNLSGGQLRDITAGSILLGSNSSTGGVNLNASLDLSANFDVQIQQGAGGSFTSAGTVLMMGAKTLNITAAGSINLGDIQGSGAVTAIGDSVTVSGSIGKLNISTTNLILNTTASVNAVNSGAGALTITSGIPIFGNLTLSTDNALTIISSLNSSGAVTVNSTKSVVFNSGTSLTSADSVTLTSDVITIGDGALLQGGAINLHGLTINGSLGTGTNMLLNNSGTLKSVVNGISVTSAAGQDLSLASNGNGRFVSPSIITFKANIQQASHSPSIAIGPGNMSFEVGSGIAPGGTIAFNAYGVSGSSITVNPSVTCDFPNDFTGVEVFAQSIFANPSQFAVHTAGHPNPNSTLDFVFPGVPGTIANSYGQVDLSQLNNLTFSGSNLAILAATDIVNSGGKQLTINLSSSSSSGGSLTLIAGFNFTPATAIEGPTTRTYTLAPGSTEGGSILLGTVNVNTAGATGGGNLVVVANKGSNNTGSISLGTVTSSGGSAQGGAVTILGNSINVGSIDTRANSLANSGAVKITSAGSVGLSNPTGTKVTAGLVTGGTFQPGTLGGAITLAGANSINAGSSSVILEGGSITGAGLVTAHNLTLTATAGSIGGLNTSVDNNITASASGLAVSSIGITNSGSLSSFKVLLTGSNGTVSLNNTGSLTLGSSINGSGGVNITLSSGSTLTNNGFQITSNDNPISITMDSYALSGVNPINAGGGTVTIMPANSTRVINLMGSSSGLSLSAGQLASITAGTLVIGSINTTGGVNLLGPINLTGNYNLQLLQGTGGSFESNSNSITMGSRALTINVGGPVNLGSVITTGATTNITGTSVNLHGSIGSTGDVITINSTNGNILGTAEITARDLSLNAHDGIIAQSFNQNGPLGNYIFVPLSTKVVGCLSTSSTSLNTTGGIHVANVGELTSFSAQVTGLQPGKIELINTGNVTLGDVTTSTYYDGSDIFISLNAGSTLTIDNGHKINGHDKVDLVTDNLVLASVPSGDYNIKGFRLTIIPTTPTSVINLGGGVGGLNLSASELASIISTTDVTLGSYDSTGGFNLYGPLSTPNYVFRQGGGGGFNGNGNALTARWIDAVGGAVELGGGSSIDQIIGSSVKLDGPTRVGAIAAHAGNITATGTITGVYGLYASGAINPITTLTTGDLNAAALGGDIDITNTGNITFSALCPAGAVTLRNTGNILLNGSYSGTRDSVSINYPAGSFAIYGRTGVTIEQDTASSFATRGFTIQTINGPISLSINTFDSSHAESEGGILNAGTATITIAPSNSTTPINLSSGTAGLALTDVALANIIAGTLIVGSNTSSGGINLNGPLDVSAKYNLQLLQGAGGTFTSTGNALTIGTKTLDINVGGAVNIGTIASASTAVAISGSSVTINGGISDTASLILVSTAGSLTGPGPVHTQSLIYSATGGGLDLDVNGQSLVIPANGGTVGGFVTRAFSAFISNYNLNGGLFGNAEIASSTSGAGEISSALAPQLISNNGFSPATDSFNANISLNTINVDDANINVATGSAGRFRDSAFDHPNDHSLASMPAASMTESDQENRATAPYTINNGTPGSETVTIGKQTVALRVLKNGANAAIALEGSSNEGGKEVAQIYASPAAQLTVDPKGTMHLSDGEVFFNASGLLRVETASAEVHLSRGALASIKVEGGCTYIRVCSGSGTVSAKVNGKLISLNSGEELSVKNHKHAEFHFTDKLARRNTQTSKVGEHAIAISDFSIMSMVASHESLCSLHKSNLSSDKRLLDRLLKTAATVQVVFKYKGAYEASHP